VSKKKLTEEDELRIGKELAHQLEKGMVKFKDSKLNPIRKRLIDSLRNKKPKNFKPWKPEKK
jgi:hypothetical protein